MEGGRGACRVKRSEPAHDLAGRQRLHGHAALPELLERGGIGPHAAVGAGAHDQMRRKLIQTSTGSSSTSAWPSLRHQFRTTRSGRMMRSLVSWRASTTICPNS
jgi:hypothetical protein